jgi:phage terminase large subunit-like protein
VTSVAEKVALLRRIKDLMRYQWDCGRPGCDGRPHPGLPHKHARAAQLPPEGDWWGWFLMAGRGAGKTRSGAEYVKKQMLRVPNMRVAIIAPDLAVGRDVCVEGESGLRGLYPGQGVLPWDRIKQWSRSVGELYLRNGSMAKIFGTDKAADAESLRGYQCHLAWFEELGTQRYGSLAYDMLEFALRLGDDPRLIITSTPRPIKIIKKLVDDPAIVVSHATTYDNQDNLPAKTLERLKSRHEGTTLGRQELGGELLRESVGALWNYDLIQNCVTHPELIRVVVAVDPAGTHKPTSDETGIVVSGMDANGLLYVLRDASGRYSPEQWRQIVCDLYREYGADLVVAEANFGADLVAANLRAIPRPERPHFDTVHASRGKQQRFEPVVGLYEQGRVWHVGTHPKLEAQQVQWIPPGRFNEEGDPIPPSKESPDRVDAAAWGITALALTAIKKRGGMRAYE